MSAATSLSVEPVALLAALERVATVYTSDSSDAAGIVGAMRNWLAARATTVPAPLLSVHPDTARLAYLYSGTKTGSNALVRAELSLLNEQPLTLDEARAAIDEAMNTPLKSAAPLTANGLETDAACWCIELCTDGAWSLLWPPRMTRAAAENDLMDYAPNNTVRVRPLRFGAAPQAVPVPVPSDEWQHLKPYGYAPGNYMSKCHHCHQVVSGVDKRSVTCRPCAEALHARASHPAAAAPEPVAPEYLFIQMDDDKRAWHRWCADAAEVREAVKAAMFILPAGKDLSAEHAEQLDASTEELMDSGALTFEGDPPLYLFRMTLAAWEKTPAAHPAPAVAATVQALTKKQLIMLEEGCWSGPGPGARFDRDKFADALQAACAAAWGVTLATPAAPKEQ